MLNPQIS